jgi:hypothetical protein
MRRLGRDTRGFPSPDRVLSEMEEYSKQYGQGIDLTRPKTVATGKFIALTEVPKGGQRFFKGAEVPTFEGSLTFPEILHLGTGPERVSEDLQFDFRNVRSVKHLRDFTTDRSMNDLVQEEIRDIPGFGESLNRVREHLRSPQMQNAIEEHYRNIPSDRPGGRFVSVSLPSRSDNIPNYKDYLDLQTQNWAEMSPEGWFPT